MVSSSPSSPSRRFILTKQEILNWVQYNVSSKDPSAMDVDALQAALKEELANLQKELAAFKQALPPGKSGGKGQACRHCGNDGHQTKDCRWWNAVSLCNNCGKTGHLARICRAEGGGAHEPKTKDSQLKGRFGQ